MFVEGSYSATSVAPPRSTGTDWLYSLTIALDQINEGVIFLNASGSLIWHNRAFDKLLVENREGHMLVAAVIELAADFYQDLEASTVPIGDEATMTMQREVNIGSLKHELHCTLMPKNMLGAENHVLCLVKRPSSRWSSYAEHLRQTWGLTEREAQVAVECLKGKKNLEIAEQLKISVETVNKHLDKVYQKASVRGRAELASRLLDGSM